MRFYQRYKSRIGITYGFIRLKLISWTWLIELTQTDAYVDKKIWWEKKCISYIIYLYSVLEGHGHPSLFYQQTDGGGRIFLRAHKEGS